MSLFGSAGSDFIKSVEKFFTSVFVELANIWYWPIIMIGFIVIAIIAVLFLIKYSYENRILKSVNKINTYFLTKPYITDDNLVEFNLKMKKVPKVLRNNWQIFMLNREDGPSAYINSNTCIDKPLRTSSIEKHLSNFSIFTIFLTVLSFITGLQYSLTTLGSTNNGTANVLFYAALVPLAIVTLYTLSVFLFRYRKNEIYSMLYDNFPLYERNLSKAVSTLPSYVDYEVLFTKKEIKEGIPILQQYLEKRALIEQQELEKARENSSACEEYNFDELGIDGSLVLERAMKECETFIKARRRLQEECDEIETEKENYKKNYEISEKDYQRKLQASRENLESLKSQQEASTNRIESNYIKKQQTDEIKKQQQLEKDSEEAAAKFKEEQVSLEQEIEKRKQEIEDKKVFVQQAMLLEFKHYANTLYKLLAQKATELGNQKLMSLAQENSDLKALMNDLQGMTVDSPSVEENLVNSEQVASQDLYEMSANDQANLESGRVASTQIEKDENEKAEEKKQEEDLNKQEEVEALPSGEDLEKNIADVDVNKNEDTQNNQEIEEIKEENENNNVDNVDNKNSFDDGDDSNSGINNNSSNDINDSGNVNNSNIDNNGNDDGGQQVDETSEENIEEKKVEDLDSIQKQIDEESANLQKQKQEFQNDLQNTISKIDNNNASQEILNDSKQEETKQIVEDKVDEISNQENESNSNEEKEVVTEQISEEPINSQPKIEENLEKEPLPTVEPRSSARRVNSRQTRASSSRASSRSSKEGGKKASSEIDALNAEMQKLLDSTKN